MSDNEKLDGLWSASVAVDSIDLATGQVCLRFVTHHIGGRDSVRVVRLESVESFEMHKHGPARWEYAEASEVGLSKVHGTLEFGIVLWDEPNGLVVRCHEVWIDDVLIERAT